jgi:hypothetical protein
MAGLEVIEGSVRFTLCDRPCSMAERALPLLCAVAPTLGCGQQSRTERADLARDVLAYTP